tara:strand:- start:2241 stop:2756 length:516 start_codon:yes stop_codon:yes gene_type:complete
LNNKSLVPIGSIVKHHGLKGDLKVFLYNEDSETLVSGITFWIKDNNEFVPFNLELTKGSKSNFLIKIKDLDNRESCSFLLKKEIYVSRSNFPDINEDEFYINDVIGFDVQNETGKAYGFLKDILLIASREILLVEYQDKEIMIPNVEDFVKLFDFENKIVIINNLEQFIEY